MNQLIVFLLWGWLIGAPLICAEESDDLPKTVKTITGRVYEGVTIKRVEPDGLVVMHSTGATKIKFEDLPKNLRERFGFDAERAAAFAKEQAQQQLLIRQKIAEAKRARAERIRQRAEPVERAMEPAKIVTEIQVKNSWINGFQQPRTLDRDYSERTAEYERLLRNVRSGKLDDKARKQALEWNIGEYVRVGDFDRATETRADLKALEEKILEKEMAREAARKSRLPESTPDFGEKK